MGVTLSPKHKVAFAIFLNCSERCRFAFAVSTAVSSTHVAVVSWLNVGDMSAWCSASHEMTKQTSSFEHWTDHLTHPFARPGDIRVYWRYSRAVSTFASRIDLLVSCRSSCLVRTVPACLLTCLSSYMLTCLPAYLLTCLPTCFRSIGWVFCLILDPPRIPARAPLARRMLHGQAPTMARGDRRMRNLTFPGGATTP